MMLKNLKAIAAALALGLASLPASADVFTFTSEFSGSGDDCANPNCATLTVTANGSGGVDFTLSATLGSGEFITGLFGNQNPFDLTEADFSAFTGTGADSVEDVDVGLNGFKADGDGFFDWTIDLSTNPPRLTGTETLSWTIANTTLAEIVGAGSVNGPADKTGFTFALRVQGLGANNQGSGWFSSGGGGGQQQVSEPSMLALFGLGLLMMGFLRRRKGIA